MKTKQFYLMREFRMIENKKSYDFPVSLLLFFVFQ